MRLVRLGGMLVALATWPWTVAVLAQEAQPGATSAAPPAAAPAATPGPESQAPSAPSATPVAPTPSETAQALRDVEPASAFDFLPRMPVDRGGLTVATMVDKALLVESRTGSSDAAANAAQRRADRAVALFVPRLDLSARYTRLSSVPTPPGFGNLFPVLLDHYALHAAVKVPVSDYFMSLKDHYDSAQRMAKFESLQRDAEYQVTAYNARREYYELARALSAEALSNHRVVQLERFMQEIDVLVQGGELGIVALAQARTRLASARAAAQVDRAARVVAEETVRRRLALPLGAPVGIAEDLMAERPPLPDALEPLLYEADRTRPEVLALRELVASHGHEAAAAEAERYPDLSLFGDVALDNPNQRYVPQRDRFDESWAVGVELTWSPTDLAAQNDAVDSRRVDQARARSDLDNLRSRVVVEITSAYEQAHAISQSLAAFEEAVAAAQQALDAELQLFRAGETTSRQVLDAELELRAAQLQWVDAVLSVHLARAALERAIGRDPR